MRHVKQKGLKSDFFSRKINTLNNSSKEICPRCMRSLSDVDEIRSQGALNYYKRLCRSSKCQIHKRNVKVEEISKQKKSNSGSLIRVERKKKSIKIVQPKIPCRVYEFEEDEKNNQELIDPLAYSKIENTLTDFDTFGGKKMNEIVGHGVLKEVINKIIIWPLMKPDIFFGLRSAPKGVLLFGPPGTGKTLIGQCIAFETKSTFFNVSSSSLVSKLMGESEKLVRTMFLVAKARQPSVIFIDGIDCILSRRTPEENGSSRRMKNEFLVHMDGSYSTPEDRILVIGATTRPQELDGAARRRFVKRLYVSLPDEIDRKELLVKLLQWECHSLEESDINEVVRRTDGYSIADLKSLSQEAAMGPIKSLSPDAIVSLKPGKIRPISVEDFFCALKLIKPSVSKEELKAYEEWDSLYGYGSENSQS